MYIVPIKNDKVTSASGTYVVESYTSHKKNPTVYLKDNKDSLLFLSFEKISEINGTVVEYNPSLKLFESFGIVKRKFHIPQENDIITVSAGEGLGTIDIKVETVKNHDSTIGISKGLVFMDKDFEVYELGNIVKIDRAVGSEIFHPTKFKLLYSDYFPYYK